MGTNSIDNVSNRNRYLTSENDLATPEHAKATPQKPVDAGSSDEKIQSFVDGHSASQDIDYSQLPGFQQPKGTATPAIGARGSAKPPAPNGAPTHGAKASSRVAAAANQSFGSVIDVKDVRKGDVVCLGNAKDKSAPLQQFKVVSHKVVNSMSDRAVLDTLSNNTGNGMPVDWFDELKNMSAVDSFLQGKGTVHQFTLDGPPSSGQSKTSSVTVYHNERTNTWLVPNDAGVLTVSHGNPFEGAYRQGFETSR